jgi:hypothetical protein
MNIINKDSVVIHGETFRRQLDLFEADVVNNSRKKEKYSIWKRLCKVLPNDQVVITLHCYELSVVFFTNHNILKDTFLFKEDESSFYQFFLDNWDAIWALDIFEHEGAMVKKAYNDIATRKLGDIEATNMKISDVVTAKTFDKSWADAISTIDYKPDYSIPRWYMDDTTAVASNSTVGVVAKIKEPETTLTCPLDKCNKCQNYSEQKEEKNIMDFNFDFGKVDTGKVRLSPYGISIKNRDGKWVSYDAKTDQVVDVDMFSFDMDGLLWKIPVAVTAVQSGDVIIHNHKPMYVINTDEGLWVADVFEGEQKCVMPLTNLFGYNFITKVVSLMNFGQGTNAPSADAPFGQNFLPMLMMNEFMKDKDKLGEKDDFSKMLMMSMVMGDGQNPFGNLFNLGNQNQ